MINVAVAGAAGRMGQMISNNVLNAEDMNLSAAFDLHRVGDDMGTIVSQNECGVPITHPDNMADVLKQTSTDVLIDFTIADASVENIKKASGCGVNLVVGTTGFTPEQRKVVDNAISDGNVSAIISSNYAIGVNVFWKLLEVAAEYVGNYDIEIIEAHHNKKKDAPSGTAKTAADVISKVLGGKEYVYGREGLCPRGNEIGIHAVRGGDIVGDHTVLFAGNGERIEIKHQAHTRAAFADGAVVAARWVAGASAGVHAMDEVLGL